MQLSKARNGAREGVFFQVRHVESMLVRHQRHLCTHASCHHSVVGQSQAFLFENVRCVFGFAALFAVLCELENHNCYMPFSAKTLS